MRLLCASILLTVPLLLVAGAVLWRLCNPPSAHGPVIRVTAASVDQGGHTFAALPVEIRHEAGRRDQRDTQRSQGVFTIRNESGRNLSLTLDAESCACAKVEGVPLLLADHTESTLALVAADGVRQNAVLAAIVSVADDAEKSCTIKVRREFVFIPAVTVSPVAAYLKHVHEGEVRAEFTVSFRTESVDFADTARLTMHNLPGGLEMQAARRVRLPVRDGEHETKWHVAVANLQGAFIPETVTSMSFAMVSSDGGGKWSAPMQVRLAARPATRGGRHHVTSIKH